MRIRRCFTTISLGFCTLMLASGCKQDETPPAANTGANPQQQGLRSTRRLSAAASGRLSAATARRLPAATGRLSAATASGRLSSSTAGRHPQQQPGAYPQQQPGGRSNGGRSNR